MRKIIFFTIIILNLAVFCEENITIKNMTRPAGYAMGDPVELLFSVSGLKKAPKTIDVEIFEKKTGYTYMTIAQKTNFDYKFDGTGSDPKLVVIKTYYTRIQ